MRTTTLGLALIFCVCLVMALGTGDPAFGRSEVSLAGDPFVTDSKAPGLKQATTLAIFFEFLGLNPFEHCPLAPGQNLGTKCRIPGTNFKADGVALCGQGEVNVVYALRLTHQKAFESFSGGLESAEDNQLCYEDLETVRAAIVSDLNANFLPTAFPGFTSAVFKTVDLDTFVQDQQGTFPDEEGDIPTNPNFEDRPFFIMVDLVIAVD